jgi:hypothetical protein
MRLECYDGTGGLKASLSPPRKAAMRLRAFTAFVGCTGLLLSLSFTTALSLGDPITATQCTTADAKGGAVNFAFQNNSSKTVTTVGFLIADAGVSRASFSYKGTYSPGASMSYRVQDNRLKPITDPDAITCFITFVQYEDGNLWHATTGLQDIVRQPDSPVVIETCNIENLAAAFAGDPTKKGPGYNLIATASFKNASPKVLSAVRIHFDVYDAFETKLTAVTGTSYGHFSSGALIEPMRRGQAYIYTPSSPAWRFTVAWSGIAPADAAQTKCWVQDARFEDGTIWRAGGRLQEMPQATAPPSTPQPS